MLHEFYDTWYAPNNAIFVIAGDVQPERVLAQVKTLFGDIPRKTLPPRPEVKLAAVKSKALALPTDLPYGLAVVSFRMPGSNSPDFAATQLLADALSSQRGSLYAMVPEGKALYAGFQLSTLPEASLGYALAVYPKGGNGDELVSEIKKILADDVKNGLPADLIEAAKRHELVDAEFQRNSVSGLAMEWSEAVAVEGRDSPDEDIQAIAKASVADVNRVARQYLKLDEAITAVLTPQASGKPVSSSAFGGKESLASTQTACGGAPRVGGQGAQPPGRAGIQPAPGGHDAAQRFETDHPAGVGQQHRECLGRNQEQSRPGSAQGQGRRGQPPERAV